MLIEDDMPRDDDLAGVEVNTLVPFVVIRVARKMHNVECRASLWATTDDSRKVGNLG